MHTSSKLCRVCSVRAPRSPSAHLAELGITVGVVTHSALAPAAPTIGTVSGMSPALATAAAVPPACAAPPVTATAPAVPAAVAPTGPVIGTVAYPRPVASPPALPVTNTLYEPPAASIPDPPKVPGKWEPEYTRDKKSYVVPGLDGIRQTDTLMRATAHAKALDDTTALSDWKLRGTVLGLACNPELLDDLYVDGAQHISELDFSAKLSLIGVANKAARRVGADDGNVFGTKLHKWLEAILESRVTVDDVPVPLRPYLMVLFAAMRAHSLNFVSKMVERTVFIPATGMIGTLDFMALTEDGALVIGDLKGLALDTPLATPDGWTTMRDVQVGDKVFGPDGRPTTVTVKSGTKRIGTFIVTFDDGSKIICDSEHIWWTDDSLHYNKHPTAKSVQKIRDTLVQHRRKAHRVPVTAPLELPEAKLPIEPYLLGAWLGDGTASNGSITKGDDLFDILEFDGHRLGARRANHSPHCFTRSVVGLNKALREEGLRDNKHIPPEYMRASITQRTRLLHGLMDTDGTWNTARRRAVFNSTNEALASSVHELLLSLGQRPHIALVKSLGFGKAVNSWTVEFNPVNLAPFRLPRKAAKAEHRSPNFRSTRRVIVSVEPGPDIETACIGVDNEEHVYLAGRNMIPTHNTSSSIDYSWLAIAIQLAQYANATMMLSWDGTHWEQMPPVSKMIAKVAVVPKDAPIPTCRIYTVDLRLGAQMMDTATYVRTISETARRAASTPELRREGDELIAWADGQPVLLTSAPGPATVRAPALPRG